MAPPSESGFDISFKSRSWASSPIEVLSRAAYSSQLLTARLTPSSLKLGLYSSLNVDKMASNSERLAFAFSRCSRTSIKELLSSSILSFANPAKTLTLLAFPGPLITFALSCLSTSANAASRFRTFILDPSISVPREYILSSTSFLLLAASATSSFLFFAAAPADFWRCSSCFFHSLPISLHLFSHDTPPTFAHSSLPSQQSVESQTPSLTVRKGM